jgi:hypothetical protein
LTCLLTAHLKDDESYEHNASNAVWVVQFVWCLSPDIPRHRGSDEDEDKCCRCSQQSRHLQHARMQQQQQEDQEQQEQQQQGAE